MRNSEKHEYHFTLGLDASSADMVDHLEKLTEAAHDILQIMLHRKTPANQPDYQAMQAAAGNLNIVFYMHKMMAQGADPFQMTPQKPPVIQ